MGDELRGDSLVHLNVRFSTEAELKQTLDFLYVKSKEGISFTGLIEAMVNEVTIVTAIHNIKSNKGGFTKRGFTTLTHGLLCLGKLPAPWNWHQKVPVTGCGPGSISLSTCRS